MALRICVEPGCPELTDSTRCERHRKAKRRAQDRRRPTANARGYDARWQRTRAEHLRLHPMCMDPEGCIQPATDVDHIDGLGPLGPRGHDHENLRSLCAHHHHVRTAKDQPGGWNA